MDATVNLKLPYLMPSQAQKHVTHNEALRMLDALVHLAVLSRTVATPPVSPAPGARYIVPAAATGAWAARARAVAVWQDGTWAYHMPRAGWLALALDEAIMLAFDGADWQVATFQAAVPQRLGINATADAPNRLALAGAASLFNHEGAGHQLKINKATAGDTASVLFQTGFSGRAEFGLAGDDDFHVKVSANGSAFTEAMVISRTTGRASFPAGIVGVREQLAANRTYYVSPSGNNTNSGLSAGSPFATLQKAVDEAHKLDCSIYGVTIQLADGAYAGATVSRPLFGGGTLSILGNAMSPANVVLTSGIAVSGGARVLVAGMRFAMAADWQNALTFRDGAQVQVGAVDFGPCMANGAHVVGQAFGSLYFEQDYLISGGATRHLNLSGHVMVSSSNRTVTLSGTPAFSGEFLYAGTGAIVALWNPTFTGGATGRRYAATTTGVINLYGKATDFLPGSVAGVTTSGGVYA